jgi:hypothetical protein
MVGRLRSRALADHWGKSDRASASTTRMWARLERAKTAWAMVQPLALHFFRIAPVSVAVKATVGTTVLRSPSLRRGKV